MLSKAFKRFSRSFTRCSRLGDGVGLLWAAAKWPADSKQTRETIRSGGVLRAFMGYPFIRPSRAPSPFKSQTTLPLHRESSTVKAGKERAVKPSLVISVLSGSTAEHLSRLRASKLWEQEWTPDRRYLEPPRQFPPPIPEFAGFHKP